MAKFLHPQSLECLRRAAPKADGDWLDVATGLGETAKMLASVQSPGATLVGTDLNPELIAVARSQDWGARKVSFVEADVYELPFEAASFDFVHARWLLLHLAEPVKALREMRRVTKSGGMVMVMEPDAGTFATFPETRCYGRLGQLHAKIFANSRMGLKLSDCFRQAGMSKISGTMGAASELSDRSFARLVRMSFEATKPAYTRPGMLSGAEYDAYLKEFITVEEDPSYVLSVPMNYTVWAIV